MYLYKDIFGQKEEYYHIAIENYYNIDEEYQNDISKIVTKSISILIDHQFIPTPCIEIKIELHHKEELMEISSYTLYIDEDKNVIDEFLITQ